jgi:hypothetical protein
VIPTPGLKQASNEDFYGTTSSGGASGDGELLSHNQSSGRTERTNCAPYLPLLCCTKFSSGVIAAFHGCFGGKAKGAGGRFRSSPLNSEPIKSIKRIV